MVVAAVRIFVAGHRGMVGSAIIRRLEADGRHEIIVRGREELDLRDGAAVRAFLEATHPEQIYLAAGKVGGIQANNRFPAEFIHENMMIAANVIAAAHATDVHKLLFTGSSCIYPRLAPQPMREDALLTGPLEPTNEPYAIAKIAGIKLCESFNRQFGRDYRSVMPSNLYGRGDNFHPENSHVIPGLMRRFHEAVESGASEVVIWGSGRPRREFLHVDDMAAASVFVMNLTDERYRSVTRPMASHLNVGTGVDCAIRELAETLARITGFAGRLRFDPQKPDGAPRKLLDVSRLTSVGWQASIGLEEGLRQTYAWFCERAERAGA
jgi:GDP-L-fucose synthase